MGTWAAALCLAGFPTTLLAQSPQPSGDQFEVNTFTVGSQFNPELVHAADGSFLIAWTSAESPGTDTDGNAVVGQWFGADGNRDGAEFQINSLTGGDQNLQDLEYLANGDIVAVWTSDETAGTDTNQSLQAKILFAAGGDSGDFQINTDGAGFQSSGRVDSANNGDFVVTWLDGELNGQRFSSDGTPAGTEFHIDPVTGANQIFTQDVGVLPDGSFAIFWQETPSNNTTQVRARRFSSDGMQTGSDFLVDSRSQSGRQQVRVAVEDGNFHAAWIYSNFSFPTSPVRARSLRGADLMPLYDTVQLDQFSAISQGLAVDVEPGGAIVVTWDREEDILNDRSPDGSGTAVLARALRTNGTLIGNEFVVNMVTDDDQTRPALGFDGQGQLVIAWDSESSLGLDTSRSIQAQLFTSGSIIFSDGFESGDFARWTTSSP